MAIVKSHTSRIGPVMKYRKARMDSVTAIASIV